MHSTHPADKSHVGSQADDQRTTPWNRAGYWTCAVGTCVAAAPQVIPEPWLIAIPYWYVWVPFGPPMLWLMSFAGVRHFSPRSSRSYRWFFLTAPFAFFWVLEGLLMIVFWMFTGFAP
jgi:hypothetical protein